MSTAGHTLVRAGEGARADLQSLGNRYLVESDELTVIEHTLAPRVLAAPIHTHRHEDEYSFVLSGRIGVQIGDETFDAGPGDLVLKPRGIPHTFWNASDEETRVLEMISPGRFGQYFRQLVPLFQPEPDVPALVALAAQYGLSMDMDSIGPLIERHHLTL
ncbi:cupin domain-containing protein [Phytoactinopolyspora endophytica]|uniref:cupin domain-containing protein n=1 Tax=Phytoactinopolyspora endophytica TaxID=1642495 RepID=UPI00101B5C5A|nr:cupin domain-containing protein [Phytoactinopolyspora endophytica]